VAKYWDVHLSAAAVLSAGWMGWVTRQVGSVAAMEHAAPAWQSVVCYKIESTIRRGGTMVGPTLCLSLGLLGC
jgi:hypothetical protein